MVSESITVAAIQMNCELGDKNKNIKKASELIEQAIQQEAAIVVLPELFNTGYRVEEEDYEQAEEIPGETTKWMENLSKTNSIYLVGAILERSYASGLVYDTAVMTGPQGERFTQRKRQLWANEKNRFTKGTDSLKVFDLGFIKVGLQICYEIGFPEPSRYLSDQGADLLIYPSAFGMPRNYAWEIASQARALENGSYVIACNRTGIEKEETEFAGNSRIVSPKGELLEKAEKEYEVIYGSININQVIQQRIALPYLRDYDRFLLAKGDNDDE